MLSRGLPLLRFLGILLQTERDGWNNSQTAVGLTLRSVTNLNESQIENGYLKTVCLGYLFTTSCVI